MADLKISQLTAATSVNYTDTVPIVQTGSTKKIAMSLFALRWSGSAWDGNSAKLASIANGTASGDAVHFGQTLGHTTITSADYTVTDTDGVVWIYVTTGASDRTITLPTLADNSARILGVKKIDSGAGDVIIDGEGAEVIDGATTKKLVNQYEAIMIKAAPTEWSVLNRLDGYNWTSYTPTVTGLGTVSGVSFRFLRNGKFLEIKGRLVTGTCTAVAVSLTLPTGHTIDTTNMPSVAQFGPVYPVPGGNYLYSTVKERGGVAYYDVDTDKVFVAMNGTGLSNFDKAIGSTEFTDSQNVTFDLRIPVTEYSL